MPIFQLIKDNWNDWFKWYTLYAIRSIQPDGSVVELGSAKIARQGMTEDQGINLLLLSQSVLSKADDT